jgi:hypothetical protein
MDDFKLTLNGTGIAVDLNVSREIALSVLNIALGGPSAAHVMTDSSKEEPLALPYPAQPNELYGGSDRIGEPSKPTSIREYVNEHEPKTNAQLVLCIGQYLAEHQNIERFTRDTIRPQFPAAGETLSKNFARDFQTAIDKGWIGADPQNREQFYITRTGEKQMETGFSGRRN